MNFGVKFMEKIGEGVQGEVYFLGLSGDKKFVVKQIYFPTPSEKTLKVLIKHVYKKFTNTKKLKNHLLKENDKEFMNEVNAFAIASNLGVSPKLLSYDLDKKAIIMEYIDGKTLDKINITDSIIFKINEILNKLYDVGVKHNDSFPRNFIIDKKGKIYIIDFGTSEILKDALPKKDREYFEDMEDVY